MTFHIPPEPEGRTQVHRAARTGNVAMLQQLVAEGADVDTPDAEGYTPLHLAAQSGTADVARLLLEAGANPSHADTYGHSPLLYACARRHGPPELVAVLREYGADPYQANKGGSTPRDFAAFGLREGLPDLLADLPVPEPNSEQTDAEELSAPEMAAVIAAVRAVVERDKPALRTMGAYDHDGDPFEWVNHYTHDNHDTPDRLVMPEGRPRAWLMYVIRSDERDWLKVDIPMWTEQEGESDLTLELEIWVSEGGQLRTEFAGLHVM